MEVILKEDVNKLGHRGDVVKVADGYGRNYLLPGKLAIEATAANKVVIEQMKASAVRKTAKEKIGAEQQATELSAVELTFERKVGENDQLFGSSEASLLCCKKNCRAGEHARRAPCATSKRHRPDRAPAWQVLSAADPRRMPVVAADRSHQRRASRILGRDRNQDHRPSGPARVRIEREQATPASGEVEHDLVDVAPGPAFTTLDGSHDGMFRGVEVLGGVLVF